MAHKELVMAKIRTIKISLIKKIEEIVLFFSPLAHLISCQESAKTPTLANVTA